MTYAIRKYFLVRMFKGVCSPGTGSEEQTILCAASPGNLLAPLWIGLQDPERRLLLLLSAAPGRSHHYWIGPTLMPGEPFSLQVALHTGMGSGGVLWRRDEKAPWSSMPTATAWGPERYEWQDQWNIGMTSTGLPADFFEEKV